MKMKTGKEGRRLACDVWAAKELKFKTEIPCSLESDTIGYAACRFLTKSEILCRDYVEQSYRLRLKQGKGRRPVRSWFTAPARMLELPGAKVEGRVMITRKGVEVQSVSIMATNEMGKQKTSVKEKTAIRVYRSAS